MNISPPKNVLLLIGQSEILSDGNYLRIANELQERGSKVFLALTDNLCLIDSKVQIQALELESRLAAGQPFPSFERQPFRELDSFQICWVLNLGLRESFLDKIQLLGTLKTRIINSVDGILHFKSKYYLTSLEKLAPHPTSWASSDPQLLEKVIRENGGTWIIKPPAGSFGRDVVRIQSPNTGSSNTDSPDTDISDRLRQLAGQNNKQFLLLQRYVEEASEGEKRVILAAGSPVGQYHRVNQTDHRNNISLGATQSLCQLTAEENALCRRLSEFLLSRGIYFAGIDLIWPWLIEVNVINPGGVTTIDELGGGDIMPRIIDNILTEFGNI